MILSCNDIGKDTVRPVNVSNGFNVCYDNNSVDDFNGNDDNDNDSWMTLLMVIVMLNDDDYSLQFY